MRLLVSSISTRHSALKKHWTESSEKTQCPLTVRGSFQKPNEHLGGLVGLIDDSGRVERSFDLDMAAGMAASEQGVLLTAGSSIHRIDPQLKYVEHNVISLPFFNALHSISRSRRGYLVASTGLDLLLEITSSGEVLWSWWATEHGFTETPTGQRREIDKSADHRKLKYGTLGQTTHVNSVAELPDGRLLATLFHQGTVIAIDRESGAWQTVLENLDHPHSARVLDEQHFTIADTVHGKALLVNLDPSSSRGRVEEEIDAGTDWLQDCSYDPVHNTWILVDGKNSRITLRRGRSGTGAETVIELDPEWRLYEALVA